DEVDQNTVDKQCAEIVKKNLLIENENLIANFKQLISKLEREYLNLQLKYQHLQESFDNKNSQASQEAPDFRSFFKIKNLEHQIQEKDNVIGHLKDLVANVNDRSREPYSAVDVVERLVSLVTMSNQNHLKESVETVREIVEETRVVKPLDTDILKGSSGTNLYTISIDEMMKSSPICLLSKASKSKSWLWHRRLNHLNFGTINDLARKDLVRGLPRLKFEKDH
ncbi:retrovirus-related pol polyprotein from transposon TNT 1-94, partial [Tanacetum coccineum]